MLHSMCYLFYAVTISFWMQAAFVPKATNKLQALKSIIPRHLEVDLSVEYEGSGGESKMDSHC